MEQYRSGRTEATKIGYVNRKNQRCCGHRNVPGNDHMQLAYRMECLEPDCGHIYGANGSDIFQRKCPQCQGGQPGIDYTSTSSQEQSQTFISKHKVTGKIVGYDPGGNKAHGVAALSVIDGVPQTITSATVRNAEEAIRWLSAGELPIAAGIDTLTIWCTGDSGWRPADRWLRKKYPRVCNSVASPNSLFGSMGLNGMAVITELRASNPDIVITETHPKILWAHLSEEPYGNMSQMDAKASDLLGLQVQTKTDHEWDAVISCYAVLQGLLQHWTLDLHKLPAEPNSRLVAPAGPSRYFWPE